MLESPLVHAKKDAKKMSSKKIFVGGLPKRYTKVEFEEYFKTHGEIDQIKLIYKDGISRGFGFLIYKDEGVAEKVVAQAHKMAGNLITVKYSEDDGKLKRGGGTSSKSRRFWVGGIPEDKLTKKEIKEYFEQYGTVDDCFIIHGRKFGFVNMVFKDVESVSEVTNKTTHKINGHSVEVKLALPKRDEEGEERGRRQSDRSNRRPPMPRERFLDSMHRPPMNAYHNAHPPTFDRYAQQPYGERPRYDQEREARPPRDVYVTRDLRATRNPYEERDRGVVDSYARRPEPEPVQNPWQKPQVSDPYREAQYRSREPVSRAPPPKRDDRYYEESRISAVSAMYDDLHRTHEAPKRTYERRDVIPDPYAGRYEAARAPPRAAYEPQPPLRREIDRRDSRIPREPERPHRHEVDRRPAADPYARYKEAPPAQPTYSTTRYPPTAEAKSYHPYQ